MLTPVKDLHPGMFVDLEGDRFADPHGENPALQYEYTLVDHVERETPACVAVYFEGFDCVGFPPDHLIWVEPIRHD